MRIFSSIVAIIVALGVAYGIAQWAGDGQPLFSEEWFSVVREKTDSIIEKGRDVGQTLPPPESIDLPEIPQVDTDAPGAPAQELN